MMQRWNQWVRFWSHEEHPISLAAVRVFLGLVLLSDFLQMAWLDVVTLLFAPAEAGGLSNVLSRESMGWWYQFMPTTEATAHLHWALLVGLLLMITFGAFTRTAALLMVLLWAQQADALNLSDRGIDTLCRNVLLILAFSGAGKWGSVEAWWRKRKGTTVNKVGAWARYLIIGQLVLMYFTAGIQKIGFHWTPMGHFSALYIALQDAAIARFDWSHLRHQPWYFFTQVGTSTTVVWQIAYPLVFLWYWYKRTPERPGRLRAFSNRMHLHLWWIGIGAIFHLLLAVTLELGIFPWAMLAMYAAFVEPKEAMWAWRRVRGERPAEEPLAA